MLIEFRVENYRSLCDEQVLTMEAGQVGDESDPRPRHVSGYSKKLLPVAGLYGANASGKSNVLAAFAFLLNAVSQSHRRWSPDEGVPRDPFAWGSRKTDPSLFEVTFLLYGVRYQYGFLTSNEYFLEEWLYAWPHGKKQVWFEREGDNFKFGDNFKGENKVIEGVTRPNALFLSAAVQFRHEQLRLIYLWFRSAKLLNMRPRRRNKLHPKSHRFRDKLRLVKLLEKETLHQIELLPGQTPTGTLAERFRDLLKRADIGIVDLKLNKSESDQGHWPLNSRFELRHQSDSDDAWLPLEEESEGTQTLFRIALPILESIQNGTLLLVDELEASLHPSLAQLIVRQFNDPATNPHNAQLIFTTHDTNLLGTTLGEPVLRRDQVWLTEKNPKGGTVLYPLTDYKPRKHENLERGYLQGRYGAIPFLGDFSVAGE